MCISITEHSVIRVTHDGLFAHCYPASQKERYNEAIQDALNYGPSPCTKEEFETFFNKTIKCLTEQYQLSMNMLDPNTQQAGAITPQQAEEVKATEAAEQATETETGAEAGETGEAVAAE